MHTSHDVVIVGAGPAGCAAATTLARQGHSVALLERAQHPRPKLCGGLLTHKTLLALKRAFDESPASLTEAGVVECTCTRYSIFARSRLLCSGELTEPFYIVNRPALDARLAAAAVRAGAELLQHTTVRECSPDTGQVATEDGRVFSGRYIIGADGATGRARRALIPLETGGLAGIHGLRASTAAAVECRIPRASAPAALRDLNRPQLYLGFVTTGYGWVFPNQNELVVGQCALSTPGENFTRTLRSYFTFLGLPETPQGLKGHPLPYGAWLTQPGVGRLLLTGDAAGIVEPTLGEGIFYATASGILAARAVATALNAEDDAEKNTKGDITETAQNNALGAPDALPDGPSDEKKQTPSETADIPTVPRGCAPSSALLGYSTDLGRVILPELRASLRLRSCMLGLLHLFGPRPLAAILRLGAGPLSETVHGHRSWHWLRPKNWGI